MSEPTVPNVPTGDPSGLTKRPAPEEIHAAASGILTSAATALAMLWPGSTISLLIQATCGHCGAPIRSADESKTWHHLNPASPAHPAEPFPGG